jgi:cytochrome bd-type quinol oxidase subunit 1
MPRLSLANAIWFVAYLLVMGAVVWNMLRLRDSVPQQYDTEQANAQWQAWRSDELRRSKEPGPVHRRVPKSTEPPAVVHMRDYFAVWMFAAVFFSTLLFLVTMFFIRGALRTQDP